MISNQISCPTVRMFHRMIKTLCRTIKNSVSYHYTSLYCLFLSKLQNSPFCNYTDTLTIEFNDFSTKIQCFFPLFHKISFLIGLQDAVFSKSNLSEYKKQPIYYLSKLIFLRGSANINPPPMAFPTVAIRRLRKSLTIGTSGV